MQTLYTMFILSNSTVILIDTTRDVASESQQVFRYEYHHQPTTTLIYATINHLSRMILLAGERPRSPLRTDIREEKIFCRRKSFLTYSELFFIGAYNAYHCLWVAATRLYTIHRKRRPWTEDERTQSGTNGPRQSAVPSLIV